MGVESSCSLVCLENYEIPYNCTLYFDMITFLSSERAVTQSDIVVKSNGSSDSLNGSTGGHKTVISVSGDHVAPSPCSWFNSYY